MTDSGEPATVAIAPEGSGGLGGGGGGFGGGGAMAAAAAAAAEDASAAGRAMYGFVVGQFG